METEFVPYEQVSSLIALGFNEPVIAHRQNGLDICLLKEPKVLLTDLSMILYQQAFRWFREKQAIEGFIHKAIEGTYYFVIKRLGNNESNMYEFITNAPKNVDTYEEAELECLKKLIEIIESKSE